MRTYLRGQDFREAILLEGGYITWGWLHYIPPRTRLEGGSITWGRLYYLRVATLHTSEDKTWGRLHYLREAILLEGGYITHLRGQDLREAPLLEGGFITYIRGQDLREAPLLEGGFITYIRGQDLREAPLLEGGFITYIRGQDLREATLLHYIPRRTRLRGSGLRSPSVSSCWQRPLGSVRSSSPPVAVVPSRRRSRVAGPAGLVAWSWSSPAPPGGHNDDHLHRERVGVRGCACVRRACMCACMSVRTGVEISGNGLYIWQTSTRN